MPGCKVYQIKRLPKFEFSFKKVIKSHYRKNDRARSSFKKSIEDYILLLIQDPFNDQSDDENFPKGTYKPEFCFRKFRFAMPELEGASSRGRLIYVIHNLSCSVFIVWVYTHEEYPKRPPDTELKQQFTAIESIIASDERSPEKTNNELDG